VLKDYYHYLAASRDLMRSRSLLEEQLKCNILFEQQIQTFNQNTVLIIKTYQHT